MKENKVDKLFLFLNIFKDIEMKLILDIYVVY